MNTPLRIFVLSSVLAFAVSGHAADNTAWIQSVQPSLTIHPTELINFNVDFPGGQVGQLITALAKIEGVSLNIIPMDEAADFTRLELPAFKLRNVTLLNVTGVLGNFLEPRGFALRPVSGSPSPNTLVLTVSRSDAKFHKETPTEFQSYRLYPFLQAQTVDDIVGAIRAGWELDPAHDPKALKLKFHPGTAILLVSGPHDAIRVTDAIYAQLKRNPDVLPNLELSSPPAAAAEKK